MLEMKSRRTINDVKDYTRNELIYQIKSIDSLRNKALCAFIYLTGARVSEIVGKTKRYTNGDEYEIEPIKKENIELIETESGPVILVTHVACLKWRDQIPRRNIPISVTNEKELLDIFMEYYNTIPSGESLFKMSRIHAWRIVNKELNVYTHYLIHNRLSYFASYKDFNSMQIQQYRGWRDPRPAATYVHLKWQDIAKKM